MSAKNTKALIAAMLVLIIGGLISYMDCYHLHTTNNFFSGIGCSLIASGFVTILNAVYIEYRAKKPIDAWKISKIYERRSDKNEDSDPKLEKVKHMVDGVAFGLSNFRSKNTSRVEACLIRGVNFRFITMNPDSQFTKQRDIEENDEKGHLKNTIQQFVAWADELNAKGHRGKITIKAYDCMTLDFYWRMDDEIYMGPYWLDMPSSQTVTYKFDRGGMGYNIYSDYFEALWNNKNFKTLTK